MNTENKPVTEAQPKEETTEASAQQPEEPGTPAEEKNTAECGGSAAEPDEKNAQVAEQPERKELEETKAKVAEYLAMAQRVQADFENFRRRNESVRADAWAEGRRDVAGAMLPVLDNLERATAAAANSTDESLRNGVELVLKQMNEVYRKLEVTPIDRQGEKFDPNLENAILQGAAEDGEPGTVCQVLQKGYRMGNKVLRHAMVKVVPE